MKSIAEISIWLGLTLGLVWFASDGAICHEQQRLANGLGLALGLARFDSPAGVEFVPRCLLFTLRAPRRGQLEAAKC